MALHKQVLATKLFADYAKDNLKLVMVDFPQSKPLTRKQQQANETLKQQFKVAAYPTLVLLDATGKELDRKSGYRDKSVEEVVAWLKGHSSADQLLRLPPAATPRRPKRCSAF
jgi:thioredoxin-related protein|tara:strand:- start:280 stop:618 length:339 start_codon:yes stop_codon:yes gene_type:complete